MKNNEIERLFSKPEFIEKQYQENINKLIKHSERLNNYFVENYPKQPKLLLVYLDKLGAGRLSKVEKNIETLHMILRSNAFFSYFAQKKLDVITLVKILTIIDKSSRYQIENERKNENSIKENIKNVKKNFDNFLESSKQVYDFEKWFMEKMSNNLDQSNKDAFSSLFDLYHQDINNMFKNKKSFNEKERNLDINYFIRELINIFNSTNNEKLPNKIIIELVSIIFNKNLDDTQIKNILKNSNKHISNTNYTLQFTTKEDNNFEMGYKKTKDSI